MYQITLPCQIAATSGLLVRILSLIKPPTSKNAEGSWNKSWDKRTQRLVCTAESFRCCQVQSNQIAKQIASSGNRCRVAELDFFFFPQENDLGWCSCQTRRKQQWQSPPPQFWINFLEVKKCELGLASLRQSGQGLTLRPVLADMLQKGFKFITHSEPQIGVLLSCGSNTKCCRCHPLLWRKSKTAWNSSRRQTCTVEYLTWLQPDLNGFNNSKMCNFNSENGGQIRCHSRVI